MVLCPNVPEKFLYTLHFVCRIKAPMEWSTVHDVLLCREMLATNPFQAKRKTTQRAKMWETIAQHLEEIDEPKFKVTVRSVRDRYSLLARKYRKQVQSEKKANGIVPDVSELDVLLEELTALEDLSEGDRENENEEKNKKAEQDRAKAVDIRKKAMEKLSDTQKRKSQEEDESGSVKKKFRRSSGDTVAYLKERNDAELALRKEELDFKKKQHEDDMKKQEAAAKRQDDLINLMAQQNQQMLNLMSNLLNK